jgi:hypothetical protein
MFKRKSSEGVYSPNLELFKVPKTDISKSGITWQTFRPINSIDDGSPVEFEMISHDVGAVGILAGSAVGGVLGGAVAGVSKAVLGPLGQTLVALGVIAAVGLVAFTAVRCGAVDCARDRLRQYRAQRRARRVDRDAEQASTRATAAMRAVARERAERSAQLKLLEEETSDAGPSTQPTAPAYPVAGLQPLDNPLKWCNSRPSQRHTPSSRSCAGQ